ncbi:MAG: helix-turn-helix transcriptional regulator [Chitinophagaceae bacterium]|nr:helix-turn-helix transcriptional regulator [Chitinophagaceae bacterium]
MAVKNVIHAIWQVDHFTPFGKEYIIPKGIIEIIFNFSDSSVILNKADSSEYHLPHCFINGFNRAPLELQLPRQLVFFGVQFQPLAVKKIFGCPASEFADITVDLALIDPAFMSLWHQLAGQGDFNKRVTVFKAWLKQHFMDMHPQEQLINNFLYASNQHDLSVNELAGSLCYSPRHLSRKLFEATGMNTEELLLYKKYLHAVHLIHHTDLPLTAVAYQSQFADQSHFIKSFKAYTKMTPGAYKRNKSIVKGHLYKDVR